ncbi:MAG: DMT family transporter, partial [Microcoleus sp. PH2017_07_MST_O_A]|nr:DMT family transporter [Microcoleus sp. PH2017_07_MST_O_A]
HMAWNARLRSSTGSPVLTTMISVFVTLLSLALVWASGATNRGSIPAFNSLPQWAWFGGVFAAYYLVASLIAIPKLGVAVVFSLVIAGQMIAALVLDSTGAFGVTQISLSVSRILGTALLLIGVILIQKQ